MQKLKLTLPLLFLLFLAFTGKAQYTTVNFDLEKTYFEDNQPLPAEERLMFTGAVPEGIDMVEISIYPRQGMDRKDPLYTALWRQPLDGRTNVFSLPVNFRLRPASRYDFRIGYFRPVQGGEKTELARKLSTSLVTYVENALRVDGQRTNWKPNPRRMVKEMDQLIDRALAEYRSPTTEPFRGLSELVEMKLEQAEQRDLSEGTTRSQLINEMAALLQAEVETLLRTDLSVLTEERYIDDYETESKPGSFAISAGYGGVYFSGDWDEFDYDDGPYLGLSFPLGNSAFAPKLLSNASLTLGAFLTEFEDKDGNRITGPIFDRPLFVGLDYKLLQFIRFNAGATLLQKETINSAGDKVEEAILIRPFIGLSARINLTVGLER